MQEAGHSVWQYHSSTVPAQTHLPLTHLHFFPCTKAACDQAKVPLFFGFRVSSSCFLPLRAVVWTSCVLGLQLQPPGVDAILSFDGTSLGIRSLLLIPVLTALCGLALSGCEVPEKPVLEPGVDPFPLGRAPARKKGIFPPFLFLSAKIRVTLTKTEFWLHNQLQELCSTRALWPPLPMDKV